jgi:hypothetical protein
MPEDPKHPHPADVPKPADSPDKPVKPNGDDDEEEEEKKKP